MCVQAIDGVENLQDGIDHFFSFVSPVCVWDKTLFIPQGNWMQLCMEAQQQNTNTATQSYLLHEIDFHGSV